MKGARFTIVLLLSLGFGWQRILLVRVQHMRGHRNHERTGSRQDGNELHPACLVWRSGSNPPIARQKPHRSTFNISRITQAEKFNPGLQLASFKNFKRTQQL